MSARETALNVLIACRREGAWSNSVLKQYILRRRVGEAQVMLYDTTDSISEIAQAVGFEDAAYFSRLFSKYVGMSPREYREFRIKK